ncbi:MAG TPA: PEGA domain-containing protein [Kofleriaceae bacterium]|nr:PEGA domain-containing protein [Kofleriaceae bacterium]
MGSLARTVLCCALMAAAAACAERATASDKELADMRAELADMRVELRGMRQELRDLRAGAPAPAEVAASADAGPANVEPPAAAETEAGAKPAKPATPPAQGTVNLQIESNPPGAVVFVAGKKVGVTPVIVKTPIGSEEVQVRLEKPGFRARLMNVRPEEDTKLSVQLAKK